MRAIVLFGITAWLLRAQAAPPQAFDVASVKANHSTGEFYLTISRGRVEIRNASLMGCLSAAYSRETYEIAAPGWLESEKYDIFAKAAADATDEQVRVMLQNLLIERFKLSLHHKVETIQGYSLTVDKGGLKVHPVDGPDTAEGRVTMTRRHLRASRASLDEIAKWLRKALKGPVVNATQTGGRFDLSVQWTPEEERITSSDPASRSIFDALREDLGLKLVPQKMPVDILVIDHAEKEPVEND